MKNLIYTVSILLLPFDIAAQHFEWAASMGRAQTTTLSSAIDNKGNINMLVKWQVPDIINIPYNELFDVYDAFGDTFKLKRTHQSLLVILQFNKQGKLNWQKCITPYGQYITDEAFLVADAAGSVNVFLNGSGYMVGDLGEFTYYLSENDFKRNMPEKTPENAMEDNEEEDYEYDERILFNEWSGLLHFKFTQDGNLMALNRILRNHTSFEINAAIADVKGGFILEGHLDKKTLLGKDEINPGPSGADVLIKTDSTGTIQWAKAVKYYGTSCCTQMMPAPQIAQTPNGNIFITGQVYDGIELPGGEKIDFGATTDKYNKNYQVYLLAFNPAGKLLWKKTSGGKNHAFSLIAVDDKTLYLSGRIEDVRTDKVFGLKADTNEWKRGFIMAFDAKNGHARWITTNTADGFTAMTTDNTGNIYCLGEYKAFSYGYPGNRPAYFHTDTLTTRWGRTILCSYDSKGKYRWMKSISALLYEQRDYFSLVADGCNNLYMTGSAFAGLSIPMQYLDGAFLKGKAYGSMAYICKIKNNINKIDTSTVTQSTDNPLFQYRELPGQAIEGQEGCAVSPGPWVMTVMPNPFSEQAKIRLITTYDDKNVSLDVYDMNGKKVVNLFSNRELTKGEHWETMSPADHHLNPGTYLVVLRGSGTILSETVVYK